MRCVGNEDAADPFEHIDVSFSVDCVSTLTVSIPPGAPIRPLYLDQWHR